MNYNTQREKLPMPEYGRAVQEMVEYAVTISDRAERQRCANTIINIMGSMFPTLRDVPDFQGKLWDHLAFMSDYKLDIDYPAGDIRYRHYGHILPSLVKVAVSMPEGPERSQLVRLLAVQMKKDLMTWNKEMVSDERIADDLAYFSNGRLSLQEGDLNVQFAQAPPQQRAQQHGKKKNKRRF